jgi:DNA (cytosine-5)-methyltransferase 1
MARKDNKVVELFAGVGGFRIGLERTGWKVVFGNQWEPGKKVQHAFDCYSKHFEVEEKSNSDVCKVDIKDIPSHDLLVGGFPCQDYSVASTLINSKGIQGKKGVLWWEIRRIVEGKKPKYIILENVDRLLKSPASQRGRDFGIILSCLNDLGYSVEWRVINAAEYGEVQRRRRTFIFATRMKTLKKKLYSITKDQILNKSGFFARTLPVEEQFKVQMKSFEIPKDLVKLSETFSGSFENSGYCDNFVCYTARTVSKYDGPFKVLSEVLEKNVDQKYYLDKEQLNRFKYMKGGKKIKRTAKNGHKYLYSEGPIAFPDYIDRPSRTMLTSESSSNRSTHIIEDPETHKIRLLTPVECERLNGFPDNWTDTGMPEKTRYFCMGNALVVQLIETMGKSLQKLR